MGHFDISDSKYASIECERRFLVRPGEEWRAHIQPYSKRFEDKYLTGTRLRLRVQTDSDTGRCMLKLNRPRIHSSPVDPWAARRGRKSSARCHDSREARYFSVSRTIGNAPLPSFGAPPDSFASSLIVCPGFTFRSAYSIEASITCPLTGTRTDAFLP